MSARSFDSSKSLVELVVFAPVRSFDARSFDSSKSLVELVVFAPVRSFDAKTLDSQLRVLVPTRP
jgi:hypothetical protein